MNTMTDKDVILSLGYNNQLIYVPVNVYYFAKQSRRRRLTGIKTLVSFRARIDKVLHSNSVCRLTKKMLLCSRKYLINVDVLQ